MATATKKKTKSIGQVAYLTKQVESLEKDLIRKDIEKLDTKIDSVKTELKQDIKHLKSYNKIILVILGVLVTLFIGGFSTLSNRIDTTRIELKQDIKDLKQDMKDLKQDINTKLDKLIERDLRK